MASLAASTPVDRASRAGFEIATRPLIGVIAVLLGAVISTLASRLTTFGLADVRGAVHAGFDEGAWPNADRTGIGVAPQGIGPPRRFDGVRGQFFEFQPSFAILA